MSKRFAVPAVDTVLTRGSHAVPRREERVHNNIRRAAGVVAAMRVALVLAAGSHGS